MATPPKKTLVKVDIDENASELEVKSAGSLKLLNKEKEINHRWRHRYVVLTLSVAIIAVGAALSVYTVFYSQDEKSIDWARGLFLLLVGYAGGALWSTSTGGKFK